MAVYEFTSRPIVIQGDIHINSKLDAEFEQSRLQALAKTYQNAIHTNRAILILAGDVFDSDVPSLTEIRLFYQFIQDLYDKFDIFILAGNHDPTVFTFLPEINFTYVAKHSTVIVGDTRLQLVSWSYLAQYMEDLISNTPNFLVSHARCSYGKFIKEEVDFQKLSDSFRQVILGDIHDYYQPYDNITYTSSPSAVTFKAEKANHGFVILHKKKLTFVPTKIPTKVLKKFSTAKEAVQFIKSLKDPKDYYKVQVSCTPSEASLLRTVSHSRVKKDVKIIVPEAEKPEQYQESLSLIKDFLTAKADVMMHLFEFVGQKKRMDKNTIIKYVNMYKNALQKKG